ncbi:MAG: filamentous hemagglutinin N-terminal domain-containing protein, partial [Gammaproteobacteria bacterium]
MAAQADIEADAAAGANQQPTVLNAANGVPLVNIQTPSAAGVSRNAYSRFDVDNRGAILNNARKNTQTQLGGWIQGNPWLAGGTARVILNEVNANNPSLLNGYLEVGGDRAQVVIANPAGITCDGCGFINANRATLTTGAPLFGGSGQLDGYLVQQGTVTVQGAGLDARQVDYTDLIARSVAINAGLWANDLTVTTGANRVQADPAHATATTGTGATPLFAIDVAQLGGMYAGKIVLVGTEAGVGVRNAGHIGASVGDVVVTADGRLENAGRIDAATHARLQSQAGVRNSGTVYAQGDVAVGTRGDIDNSGVIAARGNAVLTADGATGRVTGTATSVLGAGIQTDGTIGTSGALTINATQAIVAQGQNLSGGDQTLSAQSLDLSGSETHGQNLHLHATTGDIDITGATVAANQTLTANAAQTLRTDRAHVEATQLEASAQNLSNIGGQILQTGTGALTLTVAGIADNTQGLISATQTATLADANPANKALAITNTGGMLIAGQRLRIDSASLSGDGSVLSQGDFDVGLTQDYVHTGVFQAAGNATLQTAGTVVNRASLEAGNTLAVSAADIDNTASGEMTARNTHLTANNTLTNRGLIDGRETILRTDALNNLGPGRIYGDHVAIGATTVTNDAENGIAPIIAARDRLDIGARSLTNREHARIFSAGDMALGGGLDANNQATGQADAIVNSSATIEALGNLDLASRQVSNLNAHFRITPSPVEVSRANVVEYQLSGSPNRYPASAVSFFEHGDGIIAVLTPDISIYGGTDFPGENHYRYDYVRVVQEDGVLDSDPAQILAGGALRLTANHVRNDNSHIIVGGALTGDTGAIDNTETTGSRVTTETGTITHFYRQRRRGLDDQRADRAPYTPAPIVQGVALTQTVTAENTAPTGSGTQIAALSTGNVTASPIGPGTVPLTAALPNNRLFALNPDPQGAYLIETDPRFADYKTWLSSDYLLDALDLDPATLQKRLGDGFYEQMQIREQLLALTGRRFLDGYTDDDAQYQALMNAGVTVAKAWNLRPGIALTAEQTAALTSDIVWLVAKDVTLPDGQTTQALVPHLYVRVNDGDLTGSGSLISADRIELDLTGDLTNSGTLAGRRVLALTAENVKNLGGRMTGNAIGITTRTDLDNVGGRIDAENTLRLDAGRDLNVISTTRTQTSAQGKRTNIDRIAGLYATGPGATLYASAARDLTLNAAAVTNNATTNNTASTPSPQVREGGGEGAGTTVLSAGRD